MQGQRDTGNSFAETIDLNQGSVSSNNSPNPPTAWNSMLYPMNSGWQIGESSSSTNPNLQSQGLNGSSRTPLDINLNADGLASASDEGPESADTFPSTFQNHDGASSSSFDDWGSSVKRKALDGASSNSFQLGETFDQHLSPPLQPPRFGHSEELNLRMGIGRGVTSDVFPPISMTETGESSSRNYGIRVNHDSDQNLPLTRNTMRLSDFCERIRSSRPISPSESFEFRPASSNSARTHSQSIHTPDMPRHMHPFLRAGGSSSSTMASAERELLPRDEGSSRNSMEHSPLAHFTEIRNNLNLFPENVRNSANHSPSLWTTPQHHVSSRNAQRLSQSNPWDQFPSTGTEAGNWRGGQFPPLRSGPSSSEDMMMPPGANQGDHHHTPFSRSAVMGLTGDDLSGWHALAADIEGRQRLVSEIRQVLNAMRRGDNLRDEDYMLFDPFINGIAELHDRHRDMRLDVDNMSYEELLALEERIGDVNTGLSEEAILTSMKQRKHLCLLSSSTVEPCSICRDEYVYGDDVGELDCGHDFHTDCIKQWLTQKNICPICKMTALAP